MLTRIIELYPEPGRERFPRGTYLEHRLHEFGSPEFPFVYANFVSSLDGRIGLADSETGRNYVPDCLVSPNDFRLFAELQAQADCLITHGGYLRAIADRSLDDILQVGEQPEHEDLAAWRKAEGLSAQPAVVIASASLDFPIPESLEAHGQPVYIATGEAADPDRVRYWERRGYRVIFSGKGKLVSGGPLVRALGNLGFRSLYLVAGPLMLETMLRDRMLSRLYLTITHQVLGGTQFHTIFQGTELGVAGRLRLRSLYYDPLAPGETGQWFCQFECPTSR